MDLDKAIDTASRSCHQCASLRDTPHTTIPQSTGNPPEVVGISYAADVIKREKQLILVLRECVTSDTASCLIDDERRDTLRDSLVKLCIGLRPLDGPPAVIRTDPAPGFAALVKDALLSTYRLTIELGRVKNVNKNPVAEKAVCELEHELLHQQPTGGAVTQLVLSIATANLNTRIRNRGFSARELWTQRDQFTNEQLPLTDYDLIRQQHSLRNANHAPSQLSKSPSHTVSKALNIDVGDIVYLYCDRNKSRSRCRYLVVSVDGVWLNVSKFIGNQLRATSYRVKRRSATRLLPIHLIRQRRTNTMTRRIRRHMTPLQNLDRAYQHSYCTLPHLTTLGRYIRFRMRRLRSFQTRRGKSPKMKRTSPPRSFPVDQPEDADLPSV